MPRAERAFVSFACASFARRKAVRAAALFWIWVTVVFAPTGATLHAMSHLRLPAAGVAVSEGTADTAVSDGIEDAAPVGAGGAVDGQVGRHGGKHHDAATHCHVCDEWQFLDHVLPSAVLADGTVPPAIAVAGQLPGTRLVAEAPWILPRAPPSRR